MNEKKLRVIKIAHQLFIEKGFQATSIQDIIDSSGISKGTFYNYFSSKSELLIALFNMIYSKLNQDRNELLIGQDPSSVEIFVKQIELLMRVHRANKLITLFQEVILSNDPDLNQFIKQGNLKMLRWVYYRFIDIFGESKKPYLLDCAVMFIGILQNNLKHAALSNETDANINKVVRYSVARIEQMVQEVSNSGDQLFYPEILNTWLPELNKSEMEIQHQLRQIVFELKNSIIQNEDMVKYYELLEFIQDETLLSKHPRIYIIEGILSSLKSSKVFSNNEVLNKLEQIIEELLTLRK